MAVKSEYEQMLYKAFGPKRTQNILDAYLQPTIRGLRVNAYKKTALPFESAPSRINPKMHIPHHYKLTVTHPLHHAGTYYIQDPSATTPVIALELNPDDVVLDMCAAPGGKSTAILNEIPNGFLVSNDIDRKRNAKLVHNLQRWGVEHCVVTQNDTTTLAKVFKNTFTKVLLDAPCSGEGLYRRTPDFAQAYDANKAIELAHLQKQLLDDAYIMVQAGGVIVYSTCTLNTVENEAVIIAFLEKHPDCTLEPVHVQTSFPGLLGLDDKVMRFDPNMHGEGHFVARIRVNKEGENQSLHFSKAKKTSLDCFDRQLSGIFRFQGDTVYGLKTRGFLKHHDTLTITMDGISLGTFKKRYMDYDHELSQSLSFQNDFDSTELSLEDAYRYLYGHPIQTPIKGIHCVKYKGHALGFVKGDGKRGNNRYPKGLRNKFDTYR